ncbi:MAG: hypothetical protein ACSLFI_07525 [Solirubrobacterales bacterium]
MSPYLMSDEFGFGQPRAWPVDIALTVVHLLEPAVSAYTTGQVLMINGCVNVQLSSA